MKKLLFLLSLFLCQACFAMDQPLLSNSDSAMPQTAGTQFTLMQDSADSSNGGWNATEANRLQVVPIAGTFKNLYVYSESASGVSDSWTFTVRKNSASTTITCAISGASTFSCNDTSHSVAFAAGDTIDLQVVTVAGGTVPFTFAHVSIVFSGNANESIVMGSSLSTMPTSGTNFWNISGLTQFDVTENEFYAVMPTAGTFKNFRGKISGTPGNSTRAYNLTFRKNGVDQTLTINFSSGATTASDTTHTFAVVAGDLITIKETVVSTPTARNASWGVQFAPTTDGESIAVSGSLGNLQNFSHNQAMFFNGYGNIGVSARTGNGPVMPQAFSVKKFYFASVAQTPGAGGSYIFGVQQNGVTGFSMSLTGSNTTVSDTTDYINFAQGDQCRLNQDFSSSPSAISTGAWSIVLAPTVVVASPSTTLYSATVESATIK